MALSSAPGRSGLWPAGSIEGTWGAGGSRLFLFSGRCFPPLLSLRPALLCLVSEMLEPQQLSSFPFVLVLLARECAWLFHNFPQPQNLLENVNIGPVIMHGSPNLHTWWRGSTESPFLTGEAMMACGVVSSVPPAPLVFSLSVVNRGSSLCSLLGTPPHRTYCPSVCSLSPLLAVPLPLAKDLSTKPHQFS